MARKRIKMVQSDLLSGKVKLLYDDGTQGEIDTEKCKHPIMRVDVLVGLTLKQAKMRLGV